MALAVLIWVNASYFEDEFRNPAIMYAFLKLDFASGPFLTFFLMLFSLEISKARILDRKYMRSIFYIIPSILALLVLSTNTIISGYEIVQNKVINPVFGPAELIYDLLVVSALVFGAGAVALKYKKVSSQEKSQFIYLFIGLFLFALIAVLTNVVLTRYIENSPNYNLYTRSGAFSIILVVLFSGYSIVKHRLLNLKIIATELFSLGISIFSLFQVLTSRTASELITSTAIFVILLCFIILLVRSVENEVKHREELEVANIKLKQLDDAKSEFISIASHQLRTPITAIKGFTELLLEGDLGEINKPVAEVIDEISQSNQHLIDLVDNLLNVSRIESGKINLNFEKNNIEEICQDIANTFAIKAKEKNLLFKFKKPDSFLPQILLDEKTIREAISNVVDNALRYTSKGEVSLNIANSKDKIQIIVKDTGIGIPEKQMSHLFSKFSRGANAIKHDISGMGLGLYVAKSMAEANGARIWAESDGEGKGSRFVIEIPVR